METDEKLGVGAFQRDFFDNNPLYMDEAKTFYKFLGNRGFVSDGVSKMSWNPFTLYRQYGELKQRLQEKKIKGNLAGEGLLMGGACLC